MKAGDIVQITSKTSNYFRKKGKILHEEFQHEKKGIFYRVCLRKDCHLVVNKKQLKLIKK
jgi:hypothetical protein